MRIYKTALAAVAALVIGVSAAGAAQNPSKIFDPSYRQFDSQVQVGSVGSAPASTRNAPAPKVAASYPNLLYYQRCQEALNAGPEARGDVVAFCNASDIPAWLN